MVALYKGAQLLLQVMLPAKCHLTTDSYCFAASLFLCEVQNAQNGSLVLLRMLTECILYVIELQLYPYGILK